MRGSRPDVRPAQALQLAHRPRVGTGRLYGGALRQATSEASSGLGWRSFTYGGSRPGGPSGAVHGYRAPMSFHPPTPTRAAALRASGRGLPFRLTLADTPSASPHGTTPRPDSSDTQRWGTECGG